MKKHTVIVFGLFSLSCILFALFLRVSFLENRQKAFAALPQNTLESPHGQLAKISASDYLQGNPQANVTLIEYSDFECPSCQRMHPTYQKILKEFGNSIRFVQRMFPLPQNKNAEKEAEAALCAGALGGKSMYWKYANEIFAKTKGTEGGEGFSLDALVPLAKEVGISEQKFRDCLDGNAMAEKVAMQERSGEQAGANQLPALFITDKEGHVTLVAGEQSFATLHLILSYTLQE